MVERIRILLETRQLTPTQFADAIGIARPIVSHILSGRNKPSLEVVQRILGAMPDLSMPWLLNGTGPMLASATPEAFVTPAAPMAPPVPVPVAAAEAIVPAAAAETANVIHPSRPTTVVPPVVQAAGVARPAPRRFAALANKVVPVAKAEPNPSAAQPEAEEPSPAQTSPAAVVQAAAVFPEAGSSTNAVPEEPTALPDAPAAASPTAAALFAGAEKPIRRIVIFYRDGSFADYQPE